MKHVVLLSKDVLCARYLPTYGNKYWEGKTPNIDELAAKGTVFKRHYTAAPSTAMAFTSMFTGKYPYQTNRQDYVEVNDYNDEGGETLFDVMHEKGYDCHLVWSHFYKSMAEKYSKCYGRHTTHHEDVDFNQFVGPHIAGLPDLERNDELLEETYANLIREIDSIDRSKPIFLWVHLPHVIRGRTSYGDDIDVLDRFVGDIRERFGDFIFITADHGCNDGRDAKPGYGFDVFETATHIPLIAPRFEDYETYEELTSNIDLTEMIANGKIVKRDYVISDTSYYQQPFRKVAIISGNYKLVYDKFTKKKAMYDIIEDPEEYIDLTQKIMHDPDRHKSVVAKQTLFYPYWKESEAAFEKLDKIFKEMWNNGKTSTNIRKYWEKQVRFVLSNLKGKYKALKRKS